MPAMLNFIRQSHHKLRPWLLAAAAMLLFVSVIETGHAHGVAGDLDTVCALCQHGQTLANIPVTVALFFAPLLFAVGISLAPPLAPATRPASCTPIRAPPRSLPA